MPKPNPTPASADDGNDSILNNESNGNESFDQLLSEYDRERARKRADPGKQLEGTVVAVNAESVYLDIGYKTEGILPRSAFPEAEAPKPGDKLPVSITGRDPEGYYQLSRTKVRMPTDWAALERAFADKATIMGTVTEVIKGGLSVNVGVRAFMPASRSGARGAAEMEKLVGEEIRCRITKLDVADEDVVVDRRAALEDEARSAQAQRYAELKEGDTVRGTVRSLADYGAFVDLGGMDGLLHVGEISWSRVNKPQDVLAVGQEIEAKVLKIEPERQRISLSMKQLQAHPWEAAAGKYKAGERVRGTVTRIVDFGAFVELEPGVEGLIHISEMSWARRVKKASDVVKQGETVEVMVLGVDAEHRRMSLGLKQAWGDPWEDAARKFAPGTVVEGQVSNLTNFGAFVQLTEGVEGMVHVSDISAEKRVSHPRDVLKPGEKVQAVVLAVDKEKRQLRLGMKQLVPTGVDEFLAEHKEGDVVSGRLLDESRAELGEGVIATYRAGAAKAGKEEARDSKADLSSLSNMLQAKWKSGSALKNEPAKAGQVRSFRIVKLDAAGKKIELEIAEESEK